LVIFEPPAVFPCLKNYNNNYYYYY